MKNAREEVIATRIYIPSRLTDNKGFNAAMAFRKQRDEAALKEKQRRAQMEQLFATGPGPAPIAPTQAAPVRRF